MEYASLAPQTANKVVDSVSTAGASAQRLDHWLGDLAERYKGRILPVDAPVAQLWGRLNLPDPLPAVDGLLAATALIHDLTLVTRNTRDVARTGARVLNPFDRRG